ncbi:MAG: T9SS type A sorting domain-containing protein [Rhodothermales bacterium]|nr:T9SS type A sorting domain-containing protein [Rhodothermales bacterium]
MYKYFLLLIVGLAINSGSYGQYFVEQAFSDITFERPVDLKSPNDGSNRLFVVEQDGVIRIFDNDPSVGTAPVFLDIRNRVNSGGNEEGLLGMAFDPDFSSNGHFYVSYTASNPRRSVVSRFTIDAGNPDIGDSSSELVILEADQPDTNHNGGQIQFGPDGYLYIGLGDGGGGGDPDENGQDRLTLLGSILRIDVANASSSTPYTIPTDNPYVGNSNDFREEIWAWGLRNPWRFSFDPASGELWTGDVGQGRLEEVNIIEKGGNYGWDIMEASLCFEPLNGCDLTGLELPVWEYNRDNNDRSITGGHVYRGSRLPELVGKYIYGDFVSSRIWALDVINGVAVSNVELADESFGLASFGVDDTNELYILGFDGKIHQLNREASSTDDPQLAGLSVEVYPNPFTESVTFGVSIDGPVVSELSVFDILGRKVATILPEALRSASAATVWDGTDNLGVHVPPGLYVYRLDASGQIFTGSIVRL